MILPPDADLQQIARHANPDEMMVVIAWPNPLKSKNAQQAMVVWDLELSADIPRPMAELMTKIKERTEDMMLMTILAMILKYWDCP